MATTPKDAAAIIVLKDPEDPKVYLVRRNPKLAFMGGYHTFPGGQVDKEDFAIPVEGCESKTEAAMRAAAIREAFEEAGVLIANGAESLSADEIAADRAALAASSRSFQQILDGRGLSLTASRLLPVGRWVTPPFSPRRFDTWFFLAWALEGQEASVIPGELVHGEWIRPAEALENWKRCESVMAPPTLHALRTLAGLGTNFTQAQARFTAIPEANRGEVRRIEFGPGILFFPVKTPTLPPATHTNCYIIGGNEVVIVDPASPYEEEQAELDGFVDALIAEGRKVREIFLTHHHRDHVAGSDHLRARLGVKVAAHRLTAERLKSSVTIDRFVEDGELIELDGDPGWRLRAMHTPGHTRGHLCFYEENNGSIITGDLVVGLGTVVIDPPEGNMLQYYGSLRRLLALPKLASLFPAHGPVIVSAREKLEEYLSHRDMREGRIVDALRSGAETPSDVVPLAYTDVAPAMYGLAERSTIAVLEKLVEEGRAREFSRGRYRLN